MTFQLLFLFSTVEQFVINDYLHLLKARANFTVHEHTNERKQKNLLIFTDQHSNEHHRKSQQIAKQQPSTKN